MIYVYAYPSPRVYVIKLNIFKNNKIKNWNYEMLFFKTYSSLLFLFLERQKKNGYKLSIRQR